MGKSICFLIMSLFACRAFSQAEGESRSSPAEERAAPAYLDRASDLLHEVEDQLLRSEFSEALTLLDSFEKDYIGLQGTEDMTVAARHLAFRAHLGRCKVASPDQRGLLPGLLQSYEKAVAGLELERIRQDRLGNEFRGLQTLRQEQDLTLRLSAILRKFREFEKAIVAIGGLRTILGNSSSGLEEELENLTISMETKEQTRSKSDGYTRLGIVDDVTLLREQISLGLALEGIGGADTSLLSTLLNEYLTQYRSKPFAAFCFKKLQTLQEKEIDLNELGKVLADCDDKEDPQYTASELSFANLLVLDRRFDEALAYLEHVEAAGVGDDRTAELWYQLGSVHYRLGNKQQATSYFQRVRAKSDSFDVSFYLNELNPLNKLRAEARKSTQQVKQPILETPAASVGRQSILVLNLLLIIGGVSYVVRKKLFSKSSNSEE